MIRREVIPGADVPTYRIYDGGDVVGIEEELPEGKVFHPHPGLGAQPAEAYRKLQEAGGDISLGPEDDSLSADILEAANKAGVAPEEIRAALLPPGLEGPIAAFQGGQMTAAELGSDELEESATRAQDEGQGEALDQGEGDLFKSAEQLAAEKAQGSAQANEQKKKGGSRR